MNIAEDRRLDRYLPSYDFFEKHEIVIRSSPEKVFETLHTFDMHESKTTVFLLSLRAIFEPRSKRPEGHKPMIEESIGEEGLMTLLEEVENKEIVVGFIGKSWKIRPALFRPQNAEEFISFDDPEYVKTAWDLFIKDNGDGTVALFTETRNLCMGRKSKRWFRPYWAIIKPFSGYSRSEMLKIIKNIAEDGQKKEDKK